MCPSIYAKLTATAQSVATKHVQAQQHLVSACIPEMQKYVLLTSNLCNFICCIQQYIAIPSASIVCIHCHIAQVGTVLQEQVVFHHTIVLNQLRTVLVGFASGSRWSESDLKQLSNDLLLRQQNHCLRRWFQAEQFTSRHWMFSSWQLGRCSKVRAMMDEGRSTTLPRGHGLYWHVPDSVFQANTW